MDSADLAALTENFLAQGGQIVEPKPVWNGADRSWDCVEAPDKTWMSEFNARLRGSEKSIVPTNENPVIISRKRPKPRIETAKQREQREQRERSFQRRLDRIAKLRQCAKEGMCVRTAAHALDTTDYKGIRTLAAKHNIKLRDGRKENAAEKRQELAPRVLAARKQGLTLIEIAKQEGIARNTVRRILEES